MPTPSSRAPGHRLPTSATAHYVDGEGIRLELLIVRRRDVDVATAEVRRAEAMLAYSLGDPSQPPEATKGCRDALAWAQARLERARAQVAVLEEAMRRWP
jgi:hypothetical protein